MQQAKRSFSTSALRAVATMISISAVALISNTASAQCAPMTHTGHSPGWGSTVSSLIAPPLSVSFNHAVNAASVNTNVNTGNVTLTEFNTGVRVPITATVSGKVIHIRPVAALRPNTAYRYHVGSITGTAPGCGALVHGGHGNNWRTATQCATVEDFVNNNTVTLNPSCKYDINYGDGYYLNVNADALTLKSTLGTFAYTRGADTALQGQPYFNFVPDMYDFGLAVRMTNVTYNAAQNKWYAGTVTVTGYNDNGSGDESTPLLNTYTNVPVASGSNPPFTLTRKVTNKVWNYYCNCTILQDVSANYPTQYYANGTVTAKP